MTARGKQLAVIFGLLVGFLFPKHVECGYPGAKTCSRPGTYGRKCVDYEVEPFAFYLIEKLTKDDFGFAYTSGEECK
jgi:hypothetical protein